MQAVLVSSCLLGAAVRYNGVPVPCGHPVLRRWLAEGRVVPVCPEVDGGLPVPRPPAEIAGGAGGAEVLAGRAAVLEATGGIATAAYVRGAEQALALARAHGVRLAVLKEGSPSCGSGRIHDGSFAGPTVPGAGVASALLRAAGVRVFSEAQLDEADALLASLESAEGRP